MGYFLVGVCSVQTIYEYQYTLELWTLAYEPEKITLLFQDPKCFILVVNTRTCLSDQPQPKVDLLFNTHNFRTAAYPPVYQGPGGLDGTQDCRNSASPATHHRLFLLVLCLGFPTRVMV